MRILAISDLHGSIEALLAFLPKAEGADLLLFAGDLTNSGGESDAREIIELFGELRSRLVAVPGNCDRRGARDLLAAEGISAEGLAIERGGAFIIGSGGGLHWSGVTPYERRDSDLAQSLYTAIAALEHAPDATREAARTAPLVALTHQPPRATGADIRRGADIGSPALREALDRLTPVLWVCGHIHESFCVSYTGRTLVINPGPLKDGYFADASIDRDERGAWRAKAELCRL